MNAEYANKGSQRWLQIAIDQRSDVIDAPLRTALRLKPNHAIEWRSPIRATRFGEYRDHAALDLVGAQPLHRPLKDFWPAGGPMWDALGRTTDGQMLFVEAKAHIPEMISPATQASTASRAKIQQSLRDVQKVLAPRAAVDWSGTFYQYANRIAHLHFLRVENKLKAHLVFIYFLNAADVGGPSEKAEWLGAIRLVEGYLGVGRHKLSGHIHKIFVDVKGLDAINC